MVKTPRVGRGATVLLSLPILGLVLGAAACAAVLGIDDRTLDPEAPDASKDGGGTPDVMGPSSDSPTPPPADAPSMPEASLESGTETSTTGCTDPTCVMATALNHPWDVASDGTNVYWTEYGTDLGTSDGTVKLCPISGCSGKPTLLASGLLNPTRIRVDATSVYWTNEAYGSALGSVMRCAISGCNNSPTALASNQSLPIALAIDDTFVYWASNDDGSVHRASKLDGSGAKVLFDNVASVLSSPVACSVDATKMFLSASNGIFSLPIGGGTPTLIDGNLSGCPCPLTIDATSVYYGSGGQIIQASKTAADGGAAITTGLSDPDEIVLLNTTMYWSAWGSGSADDGTVGKVPISGGNVTNLAASLATPESLSVSGNYVFWISFGALNGSTGAVSPSTGTLTRLPK